MITLVHIALGVATLVVVLSAALQDLRERLIDNRFSVFLLALGLVHHAMAATSVWSALAALGAAFAVAFLLLVAGFVIWRLGGIGGGDVKLLAAIAFFVGPQGTVVLLLGTGLAGGVLALGYLLAPIVLSRLSVALPWLPVRARLGEHAPAASGKPSLPYGVAIALGSITAIVPSLPTPIG